MYETLYKINLSAINYTALGFSPMNVDKWQVMDVVKTTDELLVLLNSTSIQIQKYEWKNMKSLEEYRN